MVLALKQCSSIRISLTVYSPNMKRALLITGSLPFSLHKSSDHSGTLLIAE
jgi:hypothetical protein